MRLTWKHVRWNAGLVGVWLFLPVAMAWAQCGGGTAGPAGPYVATPQRPTFTSDTSTTAPGTLELEIGTNSSDDLFTLPLTIKYTPPAQRGLFHCAEFSFSVDAVSSASRNGRRVTQFSDRLGFTLRRPVYRGQAFSLAVAPQATFFLRGDSGARLGTTVIGVYAFGRNAAVLNATWTSATTSSPSNPAQQYDVAFDFARTLEESGALSRLSVFAGLLYGNPTNGSAAVSLGQGIAYRVRPHWVLDFAVRQQGLAAGNRDYQILVGSTLNLGKLLRR
ncbi:MAG: hypothetical protein ACE5IP_12150 [Terriglobia bacterium]